MVIYAVLSTVLWLILGASGVTYVLVRRHYASKVADLTADLAAALVEMRAASSIVAPEAPHEAPSGVPQAALQALIDLTRHAIDTATSLTQSTTSPILPTPPLSAEEVAQQMVSLYPNIGVDPHAYDPSPTIPFDPRIDGYSDEYGRPTLPPLHHEPIALVEPGESLVPGVARTDGPVDLRGV